MRDYYGEGTNYLRVMRRILHQFAQNPSLQGAVLDGTRWESKAKRIAQMPNSLLVWVEAPQELRKERLLERARTGDFLANFYEGDHSELEWIAPIRPHAELALENNGTLEELEAKVDEMMAARFDLHPQFAYDLASESFC